MGRIVAIGGGEIKDGETLNIDKFIVSLSGKERPSLLFIPTASHDAEEYIGTVKEASSGIGSVGISAEPVLPITIFTSSNSRIRREACMEVSKLCFREVPGGRIHSKTKSPSCSCGINSPPIRLKMPTARTNYSDRKSVV